MLDWKRSRSCLAAAGLAVGLLAALSACGGPGSCPPGNTGVPPNCVPISCPAGTSGTPPNCTPIQACVQTVVESGSEAAKAKTLYYFDFSVPDTGRLDVTMDWTDPASRVGIYLVPANTCTLQEFNARSCNFLIRSEPSNVKPRKVSVPSFNAGNYRWLLGTFSDNDESISYQFVLSKGSCPALAGALPPSLSARGGEASPAFTRTESH